MSITGTPYGFFSVPSLQGYPDGFPVLLPGSLTNKRLEQMMQYMQVGCVAAAIGRRAHPGVCADVVMCMLCVPISRNTVGQITQSCAAGQS